MIVQESYLFILWDNVIDNLLFNERSFKVKIRQYVCIDVLRVHNDWREDKGCLDFLRGVGKTKENRACILIDFSVHIGTMRLYQGGRVIKGGTWRDP